MSKVAIVKVGPPVDTNVVIKAAGRERVVRFTISSQEPDRDGDIVISKGLRWETYLTNPVVLVSHQFAAMPVAKCVDIGLGPNGLSVWADLEFAEDDEAERIFRRVKSGYINATSVGFRIRKAASPTPEFVGRLGPDQEVRRIILEAELLEISLVSIPACRSALRHKSVPQLTAADVREMLKSSKSEPTSDAEDEEISPEEKADDVVIGGVRTCRRCRSTIAECKCQGRRRSRSTGPGRTPGQERVVQGAAPSAPAGVETAGVGPGKGVRSLAQVADSMIPSIARGVVQAIGKALPGAIKEQVAYDDRNERCPICGLPTTARCSHVR